MSHKEDLIELTLHRALRHDLEPSIVAVDFQLRDDELVVHVYRTAALRDDLFAQTINLELPGSLPQGVEWADFPRTHFVFHDAAELAADPETGTRIYINYWADGYPPTP